MIKSFKNKKTEELFDGYSVKEYKAIEDVARRKLRAIDSAVRLQDLKVPPGNRLESLKGDRQGQFSIRINDQFRICFIWSENGVSGVEIVDYH